MSTPAPAAPHAAEVTGATALVPLLAPDPGEPETAAPFAGPPLNPSPYPLGYAQMRTMYEPGDPGMRAGESPFHRAAIYACWGFYKNVSRPLSLGVPAQAVHARDNNEE
jgi:hypothetical protein